jgi:hypothetical protein
VWGERKRKKRIIFSHFLFTGQKKKKKVYRLFICQPFFPAITSHISSLITQSLRGEGAYNLDDKVCGRRAFFSFHFYPIENAKATEARSVC